MRSNPMYREQWLCGCRRAYRSYSMSEARCGGREEQPHVQGAVAVWAQEGLEELFHVQGQEGQQ